RNQVTGILTREDMQAVFLDTPGIHAHKGRMNEFMLRSARSGLMAADAVLLFLDAQMYVHKPRKLEADLKLLSASLASVGSPRVIALNKCDLVGDKKDLLPIMHRVQKEWNEAEIFPISAMRGEGTEEVLGRMRGLLPSGAAMYPDDQLSTLPVKFMVSEIIREKLFLNLDKELPYNVAVQIESWDEDDDLVRVEAIILVAKSGHKPIVIGHKGAALKHIGTLAREEAEELLGKKVYLGLWVKVKPKWTENRSLLQSLGLGD
ncbi:MAG: GTPase Era, partial [Desulfonatronovibrionaceae bacterium]